MSFPGEVLDIEMAFSHNREKDSRLQNTLVFSSHLFPKQQPGCLFFFFLNNESPNPIM